MPPASSPERSVAFNRPSYLCAPSGGESSALARQIECASPPCSPQALLASTSTASTIRASGQQLRAASDSFGSHGAILCMRLCVLWLIMCLACQQFVHTRAWLLGCADRLRSGPAIRVCVVEVRRSAWDSCQRVRGAAGTIAPCGAERTSTRALVGPASVGIRFVRTLLPI
jgi:hypothetical protein